MPDGELATPTTPILDIRKFRDPRRTVDGSPRASVALNQLQTLWFNTGTLCNIECANCYIDSSPKNDRLVYISCAEVTQYLDEVAGDNFGTEEIGFTGGEPFLNPEIIECLEVSLERGFSVLLLTNAMKPMHHKMADLLAVRERFGDQLKVRVSIDHYAPAQHESVRGSGTWGPMYEGIAWLAKHGFTVDVAGRTCWDENEQELRAGYQALFEGISINIDAFDPNQLVLFPEMDTRLDVPEITTACWGILDVSPNAMMCASSRMIVKRKGTSTPTVVPCTLLPYEEEFDMGSKLADATGQVPLNHPHCARFCVLGGGACSVG